MTHAAHTHAIRRPIPRRGSEPPDPTLLARAIATAFLEIEAGRRPLRQLEHLLAPALRMRLATSGRRPPHACGPDASAVLSVRADRPSADAVDAAVVVRRGRRVGALAIRLERHRGIWRITDIARPESELPAARTGSLPGAPPPPDAFDELDA